MVFLRRYLYYRIASWDLALGRWPKFWRCDFFVLSMQNKTTTMRANKDKANFCKSLFQKIWTNMNAVIFLWTILPWFSFSFLLTYSTFDNKRIESWALWFMFLKFGLLMLLWTKNTANLQLIIFKFNTFLISVSTDLNSKNTFLYF